MFIVNRFGSNGQLLVAIVYPLRLFAEGTRFVSHSITRPFGYSGYWLN